MSNGSVFGTTKIIHIFMMKIAYNFALRVKSCGDRLASGLILLGMRLRKAAMTGVSRHEYMAGPVL